MAEARIDAETRTEFGKGAARRTRRAGKIPAVLYGHGTDPQHLALPELEFKRALREQGRNAVVTLNIGGTPQLALTKTVVAHPIRPYIEHIDLLVIRRGEKVVVEVGVIVTGEAAPGTLVTQELNSHRARGRRLLHPGADRGLGGGAADRHPDPGRGRAPCPRAPSCAPTRRSWWSTWWPRRPRSSWRPSSTPRAPAWSRTSRSRPTDESAPTDSGDSDS